MNQKLQEYLDLREKHTNEMNHFPIAYAFSQEQLEKALIKLNVKDVSECTSVFGIGDIVRTEDAPKLLEMMTQHTKELRKAMKDEVFAEEAFLYEMNNHEYAINWDGDADVLSALCLKENDLDQFGIRCAYNKARKRHYTIMEEKKLI